MTHPVDFQHQTTHKFKRFQEFVFVSDSALKLAPDLSNQLQLDPDSSFLDRVKIGDFITIKQIHAPQNIIHQLRNLKFKPDQKVQLVSKTNTGSVVVNLNNTLIGIGKEIAQRVVVTLVGEAK
ncbi:MAG: ferrous iron transport protein A [Pleurocapsa minor HA4230-MV1]|jgi:ferrous iron transport protein A|nr:ferrous iron transport protein A [Pleurocapsa minor HA4230-MV1]